MIRCEHRVELAAHCSDEHRVGGQGSCGTELRGGRLQHPILFITKEPRFTCVWIDGTDRQPGILHPPPLAHRPVHRSSRTYDAFLRQKRRHIPERNVRRNQYDPKCMTTRLLGGGLCSQHHGDVDVAREMSQPFGMSREGKPGEM